MHLISLNDVEQGLDDNNDRRPPPQWLDQLEEAQYLLTKLKTKIDDLKKLHDRDVNRPTFDDSSENEALIEACTNEITMMFTTSHRLVQFIKNHLYDGVQKERLLTNNVTRSLCSRLQDLSIQFKTTQSNYLKKIQSREERSKSFFENQNLVEDSNVFDEENIDDYFLNSNNKMTQQQLLYLEEENTKFVQQREQEVNNIVKSIVDLNDIFKDLSQMVAEQGTVLDRIDYNVEQTQSQVYEGFKQLQKADAYQRKNRKMCVILVLAAIAIILFFILVVVKS